MQNNFQGKVAVKVAIKDEQSNLFICKKINGKFWEIPGGRIDENESIKNAIERELKEELNINLENLNFKIIDSFQAINPNENISHLYIIVELKVNEKIKNEFQKSEEANEQVWINKNNYKNYNYPKFLENVIENIINL
jgi:8-oxo-dGTP diphosphatase